MSITQFFCYLASSESIEAQLRAELEQVRLQLKTKDEECQTLEQIRVDLESEVSELTASLFEEANKMVGFFKAALSSLFSKLVCTTLATKQKLYIIKTVGGD